MQMSVTEEHSETEEKTSEEEVIVDVEEQGREALSEMMGDLRSGAENARVSDYTAVFSNIQHGHGVRKGQGEGRHDVRTRFNVNDEFVAENFITQPNDHAAIYEMAMRRSEFEQADEEVFSDTHNGDASRWNDIESFARSGRAPIPDSTRRKLKAALE